MVDYTRYIGIPYVVKKYDEKGCDCWGLVYQIYKNEHNVELPTYADSYITVANLDVIAYTIDTNKTKLYEQVNTPKEGDIVIFKIKGQPVHCGLYIGNNMFIHNFVGTNSCIEDLRSPKWSKRIEGFYRYVGNRK